jgi:hypothetical protein
MEQLGSRYKDFHETSYWGLTRKSSRRKSRQNQLALYMNMDEHLCAWDGDLQCSVHCAVRAEAEEIADSLNVTTEHDSLYNSC